MEDKINQLRKISTRIRKVAEERWVDEYGIENILIHSPHHNEPIHIQIIETREQLEASQSHQAWNWLGLYHKGEGHWGRVFRR